MPAIGYEYNLLNGLSSFWTRFFSDAPQLDAMYQGTAMLIGQAYLDLMSATLGIALKDAVALDREYYRLVLIREDEIAFIEGDITADNRWAFVLTDGVVDFASLDNRVVEPTASLEPDMDFDIVDRVVQFRVDPTDPSGTGIPLPGYARRSVDVETGGKFTDQFVISWLSENVKKGDTLRTLDVGTDGTQRKRVDYPIVLLRPDGIYVSEATPFPTDPQVPASGYNYVILRKPSNAIVTAEAFTTTSGAASFAHTRLDAGSVRVFAKTLIGSDVVEGVDYLINYEHGKILALTTWFGMTAGAGTYAVDYTWLKEIKPSGGASPQFSQNGIVLLSTTTVRVLQISMWAPDTRVDRYTLANNFGALIGRQSDSSEAYRSFLSGIFQLYILGPVLERIESALNVVMNLPVVRDDGELYQSTDTTDPLVDRIFTTNPTTLQTLTYEFPKGTPLRTDLVAGTPLLSFDPLTTAVAVTDYVQTPDWWYGEVIPNQLFTAADGSALPIFRRTASPVFIQHVVGPSDDACFGDPGLYYGASDDGDPAVFGVGHTIFRHRLAFVLMDRYLKFHTFSVKFNATALSATIGAGFAQSLKDLNDLVLSAKPSHTYVFTTPSTFFEDEIEITEDPISFARLVGSRIFGPDKVIFADDTPTFGAGIWNVGDYFKYEFFTSSTAFPSIGVAVTLSNAPGAPRHGRLVRVYLAGTIGGHALVENVDYSVNYANRTVTRLTAWFGTTINVTFRQLNIGNLANAAIGSGDMPVLFNGVDPAIIAPAYNPAAAGWDGVVTPATAPRDIGMVERALIVHPH